MSNTSGMRTVLVALGFAFTGIGTPTKQGRILPSGKSYPGFVDKKVKKNQVLPSLLRKSRQKKIRVDFRHWRPNIPILSIGIWGHHNGCPKSRLNQFVHRGTVCLFVFDQNEKLLNQHHCEQEIKVGILLDK